MYQQSRESRHQVRIQKQNVNLGAPMQTALTDTTTLLRFLLLFFRIVRMLDCQAPDIEIVADRSDDVVLQIESSAPGFPTRQLGAGSVCVEKMGTHHETPINAHSQPHAQKHERHLIHPISQHTWPYPDHWSQRIHRRQSKRQRENIVHRKFRVLGQMRDNNLTNGIGVDKADVKDERDEVVVQYDWLKVEIERDKSPREEVREQAVEGREGVLGCFAADLHHIEC